MEALLAALGHDVVELDRLQVQRSECKVADKWKVELCHLAGGWWYYGGTMVEKKITNSLVSILMVYYIDTNGIYGIVSKSIAIVYDNL